MSKHTPGPWTAWRPISTGSINPQGAAFVIGPTRIAMDKTVGFSIADASLIAAAPDLLEALEVFMAHGEQAFGHDFDVMIKARAAIAKARGET